ncbi:MAG: SAM-dependent methyltransferase [Marinilabiliales bacterium]|mgnify:CR=1 FL=1|nr:MAG: SAM-dependent methyltransferase [Marinilabiliales bacterium]
MDRNISRKDHWNNIYETKDTTKVSWYQQNPETALKLLRKYKIRKEQKIIDIGGGDSCLVDNLLKLDYQDITILDVSKTAIQKSKERLGNEATKVKWLVEDAANFKARENYDFWYDRAAFHFLVDEKEIDSYINTVNQSINPGGYLVIATFSKNGPDVCSGLKTSQYSEEDLCEKLKDKFIKEECFFQDHNTPSGGKQNFIFCCFRRK